MLNYTYIPKEGYKMLKKPILFLKFLTVTLFLLMLSTTMFLFTNNDESNITDTSVTILNMLKNSGGSGVVVGLLDGESEILTNRHVCQLVKDNGGYVISPEGEFLVTKTYASELHDMCIVVISARLSKKANISQKFPQMYDKIVNVGHPKLLPTTITDGYFSSKIRVDIMVDLRECSDEDWKKYPDVCLFVGGMPIIRKYEATSTSVLIQPGSSGSGVFNANKELIGLIFAGSGSLGFGLMVPYQYVTAFYSTNGNGKNRDLFISPNYTKSYNQLLEEQKKQRKFKQEIKNRCLSTKNEKIKPICNVILNTLMWRLY
jgi:hypothetical protein